MKILAKIWANMNPAKLPLELRVEKIKNGYLVATQFGEPIYFKTKESALEKIAEIISGNDE